MSIFKNSSTVLKICALTVLYVVTARTGLKLNAVSGFASLVWPPTGISLAALLVWGPSIWPGIFLGAWITNISMGAPASIAFGIALGNLAEAWVAFWILKKLKFEPTLGKLKHTLNLFLFSSVFSTIISATIGVIALSLYGSVSFSDIGPTWTTWWLGDLVGSLVVAPFLLVWSHGLPTPIKRVPLIRIAEAILMAAGFVVLNILIFTDLFIATPGFNFPNAYFVFPLLMLIAMRFHVHGTVTANLVFAAIVNIGIALGHSRPWNEDIDNNLFSAQIFVSVVAVTKLLLASALQERRQTELEKQRAQSEQQFLAKATRILSESIDYKTTLQRLVQLCVPQKADWCIVHILSEDQTLNYYEMASAFPEKNEILNKLISRYLSDLTGPTNIASVIKNQKSKLIEVGNDEHYRAISKDAEHYQLLKELSFQSLIVCPVALHGKALGAISVVSSKSGPRFGQSELALFEELARRAAISIENARLYREAQEAILMRDEFLSIASHELKTPLTALSLQLQVFSRALRKSPSSDDNTVTLPIRVTDLALKCEKQGEKLKTLLDELLDLTRIRLGKLELNKESVDLGTVTKEIIERFKTETAQKGIPISLRIEGNLLGYWDPIRVEQVVSNLVSNAIKYGEEKPISVFVETNANTQKARIVVRDEGMGIPEDMISKIFERFERADISGHKIPGLGLGLYICRQIVQAHGGSIDVQSTVGKGSTFTVEIPLNATEKEINAALGSYALASNVVDSLPLAP